MSSRPDLIELMQTPHHCHLDSRPSPRELSRWRTHSASREISDFCLGQQQIGVTLWPHEFLNAIVKSQYYIFLEQHSSYM